ncbi:transposase [Streptomyces sp. NBC_01310]|nr:transposase [Streptomyces sp. NBC_01310]
MRCSATCRAASGRSGTVRPTARSWPSGCRLGSLGLVLNAVVLWTRRYIDAAVARLRDEGHEIRDEDVARPSPLKHRSLNVLGRYGFTASGPREGRRPLRDPDAVELDGRR